MGSLRGEDGDGRPPPDNGGLPDLPPEWGTVVIPDDLTELGRETTEYQRAIRRTARRNRWRRRFHLAPKPDRDSPPVGIPLLIMCIAIVAALTSLFAVTVTTHGTPDPTTTATTGPAPQATPPMVDLGLADSSGKLLRTDEHLPAVFLLLDGCACGPLITETAAIAPASVTVLVVDKAPPFIAAGRPGHRARPIRPRRCSRSTVPAPTGTRLRPAYRPRCSSTPKAPSPRRSARRSTSPTSRPR